MANFIKPNYQFCDIFIFKRSGVGDGYISLSDFEMSQHITEDDDYKFPDTDEEYLVGLPTADYYLIAPITVDEIILIAGLSPQTNFIRQCKSNLDNEIGNDIVATICAKRIVNYNYGKVKRRMSNDEIVFEFYRRKIASKKPIWKAQNFIVLEKTFKRVML